MTKVQLLKPHTHAGHAREPGAVLELDEDAARWLIDAGIARAMSLRTAPPAPKPEEKSK